MFDYIYEWLKNLSAYLLLVHMVMGILPNEEYRKYIRFFCGLVLIVMLMTPILQLFELEADFKEIYHSIEYKNVVEELKKAGEIAVIEREELHE